jgi:CMP-N,N'-diacetyllegionaminic acid synthase
MEGIYVLIPARSGSKSLPHKNIKDYFGYPLLVHSIFHAQNCKYIKKENIYVSTDSDEYGEIALKFGTKVIKRPEDISGDLSTDLEVFQHFLGKIEERVEIMVHLRPTYPNRRDGLLEECIKIYLGKREEGYESLRTVVEFDETPYKMYHMEGEELKPIFEEYGGKKEPYNLCRQIFPKTFLHNGCIDIIDGCVVEGGSMTGKKIFAYKMEVEEGEDIDTEMDFIYSMEKKK